MEESNFNKEDLEFHLPDRFNSLSKQYILDCMFNDDIQDKWYPKVGDVIVGCTGNVFVISSKQTLVNDLGGDIFFFGGHLCTSGSSRMDTPRCYVMNKNGINTNLKVNNVSKFSDFRYVPYPHEKIKIDNSNELESDESNDDYDLIDEWWEQEF